MEQTWVAHLKFLIVRRRGTEFLGLAEPSLRPIALSVGFLIRRPAARIPVALERDVPIHVPLEEAFHQVPAGGLSACLRLNPSLYGAGDHGNEQGRLAC